MLPHPFQMMILGAVVSEWENADRKQYVQNVVQQHTGQLQRQLKSVLDHYQQLWDAYQRLEDHVKVVEAKREELRNQVVMVIDQTRAMKAPFEELAQGFKGFEKQSQELFTEIAKKLDGYELLKKLAKKLSANADLVFASEVTAEDKEKLAKFLDQLP